MAFCAHPALAWERHGLLTRPLLARQRWLDAYGNIVVEPATTDPDPVNASYVPVYIDHLPGAHESARAILERYVDEPAWGMDTGVQVSPWQGLDGGSRSYRQNYDYFLAGVVRVGDAPARAAYFYHLAVSDMKSGHTYWAFRELARSLFYLEELGDPLDTQPFQYSWIWQARFDMAHVKTRQTNYRLAYDAFVQQHLEAEFKAGHGPLLGVLKDPPAMPFADPLTAARALAEFSHGRANHLLNLLDAFLPARIKSATAVVLPTAAELDAKTAGPGAALLLQSTADSLQVTGGTVLSVLEMARKDFTRPRK